MAEEFTIGDIVRILGIPRERFKAWTFEGFVAASVQQADGKGTVNRYSPRDIYGIAVFDYLVKRGLSREVASGMYRAIISVMPDTYFESKSFRDQPFYAAVVTRRDSTGVAFILRKNFSSTFEKLFLRFDDPHGEKDVSELDFDDAVVINLRRLFEVVSLKMP